MDLQKGMTPKEKRADNREADRRLAEELKKQRWDEGFSKMDSRILAEIPRRLFGRFAIQVRPEKRGVHSRATGMAEATH